MGRWMEEKLEVGEGGGGCLVYGGGGGGQSVAGTLFSICKHMLYLLLEGVLLFYSLTKIFWEGEGGKGV